MSTVLAATPPATHHAHATREAGKRHAMSSPRLVNSTAPGRSASGNSQPGSSPSHTPPRRETQTASNEETEERRDATTGSGKSSPGKRTPTDSRESHAKLNALADASSSQPAIKQERAHSPELGSTRSSSSARHRPSRLDLTNSTPVNIAPNPSTGGLTSRDPRTGQLSAMQDVGLACISPGFQTDNPSMQQQLAKALQTRDQQRHIIESRLNKTGNETIAPAGKIPIETTGAGGPLTSRIPGSSRRRGPPPGLSINAPSATHFANEPLVVQSAPLNQSFTGLRVGATGPEMPLSRHVLEHSRRQEPPAPPQTAHRLPPIQDVISGELNSRPPQLTRTNSGQLYAPITNAQPSKSPVTAHHPGRMPSPQGYPPHSGSAGLPPTHNHHSGDEAQAQAGRHEEMPKIVHYGGHQPPTPPSPLPHSQHQPNQYHGYPQGSGSSHASGRSDPRGSGRRRTREEFERDYVEDERRNRPEPHPAAGLWEARLRTDSPETARRKKEEFMNLVSRAWDLLKS